MRFFLSFSLSLFIVPLLAQPLFDTAIINLISPDSKPFPFGVASGDPQQNSVVIWTKIWNENEDPATVQWQVATDTLIENIVASGEAQADFSRAYTIKILVENLEAGTTYFYRFKSGNNFSPIGRTKTAPENPDNLRFAVASCSNYEQGYYNVYRMIAESDLDAVIYLGDYIYEYGASAVDGKKTIRSHIPAHEVVSLQDYRSRYALSRLDSDLQEVHRLHPFIIEWDDHEIANNTYKDGAGNHQPDREGDWETRKSVAKQAYFEWIPITDNDERKITRKISYGNLAEIFLFDSRTEARTKQGVSPYDTTIHSQERTMIGNEQSDWLIQGVINSPVRWKVLANQVVFSEVDGHRVSKKYAINPDAWDGYPVERKKILDSFYAHNVKNIIIITGDIHSSWAFDLVQDPKNKQRYNRKTGKGVIGAEFVSPSVSSNGLGERVPRVLCNLAENLLKHKGTNPHLRFANFFYHGFILLNLNNDRVQATWKFCKTIRKRTNKYSDKNSWISRYNDNRLEKAKKK